ncbi:MAG: DUF3343 domain-containing protein [Clostridiaceae bacterium]|jgi:hypothetical protein|nr:DUF3343 domain-containing protein [Clostridiaceae bacterium]
MKISSNTSNDSDLQQLFVATFFTHYGAITFCKTLRDMGDPEARMIPAPRSLSVSCGSAVIFSISFNPDTMPNEDTEGVFRIIGDDDYVQIYEN